MIVNQKTVFIVGAGFSRNAGLPIQSEFTELMLAAATHKSGMRRRLMPRLSAFMKDVFDYSQGRGLEQFPDLEDIFTAIDLSANTGHHLGPQFTPQKLRELRRILLSNIIRMLNSAYLDGQKKPKPERASLLYFLSEVSAERHQFVSLNWDVVLESCFVELDRPFKPFYGNEIKQVILESGLVRLTKDENTSQILISKMHGSINWLYCDCCRRTFAVPPEKVGFLGYQVLKPEEVSELFPNDRHPRLKCPECNNVDLTVRLATFSYQKAMRTPMFESCWIEAEKALRDAKKWVFIGYSLPQADFEFKYLLKRIQLARRQRPSIQVVSRSNDENDPTVLRYKKLFGDRKIEFFGGGLSRRNLDQIL